MWNQSLFGWKGKRSSGGHEELYNGVTKATPEFMSDSKWQRNESILLRSRTNPCQRLWLTDTNSWVPRLKESIKRTHTSQQCSNKYLTLEYLHMGSYFYIKKTGKSLMPLENKFCDCRLFINSRVGRAELIWARKEPWGKKGGVSVWISGPVCTFLAGWAWLSSYDAITVLTWLLWRFSSKLGSLNPFSSVDWELWLHTERERYEGRQR